MVFETAKACAVMFPKICFKVLLGYAVECF